MKKNITTIMNVCIEKLETLSSYLILRKKAVPKSISFPRLFLIFL